MIWLYLIGITFSVLALGAIIPIVQFLLVSKNNKKNTYTYSFPSELFNMELDSAYEDEFVSRSVLSMRGWIRGPQGNIITKKAFQEKRENEYNIELP